MSSPLPSSIFLCNADDESAEQPSDDTATMIDSEIQSEDGNFRPETTPTDTPIPPRPSHLEHPGNKNIRHGGDLMHEEVVLMTHPVDIVLQLLGPACLLLCELHQVLRLKPSEFPKVFNAQAVCVHKECIATKQGYIDVVFGGNIVGIGDLAHKGLEDRLYSNLPLWEIVQWETVFRAFGLFLQQRPKDSIAISDIIVIAETLVEALTVKKE
ncbi:hypothetical protein NOF04DRAFT_20635 [Fusarium oxysporum II5]|uniref:Uncharacterized protein n=1 Tax=Fusarium odoratissimum (strain NRRL 54006) TaxID=1089451 RepID=X0J261_FUSO5|nr:uncharacterized protein FOIG_16325 [Fusarium odoratissimum NRRL 54006]EXL90441.1 hypothetical protein FOIG_16325 [Fusarium odoratissimum NRRL 54006]KAK2134211.1 hypothetical protein NOF04DRAFT_20635 [Fusarium oxysporum II5]